MYIPNTNSFMGSKKTPTNMLMLPWGRSWDIMQNPYDISSTQTKGYKQSFTTWQGQKDFNLYTVMSLPLLQTEYAWKTIFYCRLSQLWIHTRTVKLQHNSIPHTTNFSIPTSSACLLTGPPLQPATRLQSSTFKGFEGNDSQQNPSGVASFLTFFSKFSSPVVPVCSGSWALTKPDHNTRNQTNKSRVTSFSWWDGKRLWGSHADGDDRSSSVHPSATEDMGSWVTPRGRPTLSTRYLACKDQHRIALRSQKWWKSTLVSHFWRLELPPEEIHLTVFFQCLNYSFLE